jgi:hypothetical protein
MDRTNRMIRIHRLKEISLDKKKIHPVYPVNPVHPVHFFCLVRGLTVGGGHGTMAAVVPDLR